MKIKIISLLIVCIPFLINAQHISPSGGGKFEYIPKDEITGEQRAEIFEYIHQNIALLKQEGRISNATAKITASEFIFPLQWSDGYEGYNFYGISNYVDQNTAFPGLITDYNCGTRSYDTEDGYNHQGIDYFLWPFDWNLMDAGAVKIVSAAPGLIVGKYDGQPDQSCVWGGGTWNAVYVRHDDGSIAWYGHMKNGSTTAKGLGDSVALGEYLGLVGSSGNSSGPHLHFEIYDTDDNLIDPYSGACNNLNDESWWIDQPEYIAPVINKIQTHNLPPVFNPCPDLITTNESDIFMPGDEAYFAIYAKDLSPSDLNKLKITRADGSVWYEWEFYQPDYYYVASYWYWYYTIPLDVPEGMWKWSCELAGNYYEHEFLVGALPIAITSEDILNNISVQLSGNIIQLNLTATESFDGDLIVTNLSGQNLLQKEYSFNSGTTSIEIPFENFSSGIYMMNIRDSDTGNNNSIKFIKVN